MKYFLLLLIPAFVFSSPFPATTDKDIMLTPEKASGYFQGWNVYFTNRDYFISVNYVVSNIGPGDLNNGIHLVIQKRGESPLVHEREFSGKELEYSRREFKIQLLDNFLFKKDGKFYLNAISGDLHLYLIFEPRDRGVNISNGRVRLASAGKYLAANIVFSRAKVYGVLAKNGNKENLLGNGSMEHLLTNEEVYKFSTNWFIMKSLAKSGHSVLAGGFQGNKNYSQGMYKTVSVLSPQGKIVYSGQAIKRSVLENTLLQDIDYKIVSGERLDFDESGKCYLTMTSIRPFAKINVLANVSIILRKIIQIFFAKPYQIYSKVETGFHCNGMHIQASGDHSYFLVNPEDY